MRPPQNAGENLKMDWRGYAERLASMRPPQNAGENAVAEVSATATAKGFNEAPAECGGKLLECGITPSQAEASMRPPQNAGENSVTQNSATVTATLQ